MNLLGWLRARLSQDAGTFDLERVARVVLEAAFADLNLKNFDGAREQLLRAFERRDEINDPTTIEYMLTYIGASWRDQGRYQEGIEFLSAYIATHPGEGTAYSQRGGLLWYSGNAPGAISDFSRALEILPSDTFALLGRGHCFVECERYREAFYDFDLAQKYGSQDSRLNREGQTRSMAYILNGRAAALAGLGDFEESMKQFESSIGLSPDNSWVYYNRARAYTVRGEFEKAISDYRLALSKHDPALTYAKKDHAEAQLETLLAKLR